jgi:hypothetical protein
MTPHRGALPTLTEVIELDADPALPAAGPAAPRAESMPLEAEAVAPAEAADVAARALESLRPQVDALLDARLQALLPPQLSRLADELAHQLRDELAITLRALVIQAVDEALAQRRKP